MDEQESLVNQADLMGVASAMNDDNPPFGPDPMNIPMPANEFGNTDF